MDYAALYQRAKQLEEQHGFRLCSEDFKNATTLSRAMNLFRPLDDFLPEARRLKHPFSLLRAARLGRLTA